MIENILGILIIFALPIGGTGIGVYWIIKGKSLYRKIEGAILVIFIWLISLWVIKVIDVSWHRQLIQGW